jgi:hypothetical protein
LASAFSTAAAVLAFALIAVFSRRIFANLPSA